MKPSSFFSMGFIAFSVMGLCAVAESSSRSQGTLQMAAGVLAFQESRWQDAMTSFLNVLNQDPANRRAHIYIQLIARRMRAEQEQYADERRMDLLRAAAFHLEQQNRPSKLIENAIAETSDSTQAKREKRSRASIEEASIQRGLGHLYAAYDLVFQILQSRPDFPEALHELSEIQMAAAQRMNMQAGISASERYALSGFYAFGEADYAGAVVAWKKVHTILEQTYPDTEVMHHLRILRLGPYEAVAQARVEDARRAAEIRDEFERAKRSFDAKQFEKALDGFRRVAVANPDYPGLADALIGAEAAQERDQARRLGEEKQEKVLDLFGKGTLALEQAQYDAAEKNFTQLLQLDPTHRQAKAYLAMIRTEIQRRQDPKAAQAHYETGLVSYASGKLEDAQRAWKIALRINPHHDRAKRALEKVQRELLYAKESF